MASASDVLSFRKILCPVDFSESSRHAIDQSVAIAHYYGGTVRALHVVPFPSGDPMVTPMPLAGPDELEVWRQDLERFVSEEVDLKIDCRALQGHPIETIVSSADAFPADLIVMGSHGRSGFERLMLGSVTERVLRKAHCPVMTVPKRKPDAVPAGPVAFQRILCALDFSAASNRALAYAESLARHSGAHLTLVHVIEPVSVFEPMVLDANVAIVSDLRKACVEQVHAIAPRDCDVAEAVLVGKPYREILQRAAEDKADLIVMGVHSGLADRFHLGSTANHLVRGAECCVLSIR